jgi:AcrR family transcriptional regulator
VLAAAKTTFERGGWSGATIAAVAASAGVSPKTVEAIFGTKAALLAAAVDYAIRGDAGKRPMPQRQAIKEMEDARDARTMLRLHAAHLRRVNSRSAGIARVVEQAADSDTTLRVLSQTMNDNRAYAVQWAAATLMSKTGRRATLTKPEAEATFWVSIDWGTFRTLTRHGKLSARQFEEWLNDYYTRLLLD